MSRDVLFDSWQDGPIANPFRAQNVFDRFLNTQNINGIILQTSNHTLLDYASGKSGNVPNVGIAALGSFFERYNTSYP